MKKTAVVLTTLLIGAALGFTAHASIERFSDQDSFAPWYSKAASNMLFSGIMSGYEDNTFRPGENINRAELAVMFDRFASYMGQDLGPDIQACTMQYVEGMTIYLYDSVGNPVEGATVKAQNVYVQSKKEFATGLLQDIDLVEGESGIYTGIGEGNGQYNITIEKEGYITHRESITLNRDDCHVIPQMWTRTLLKKASE